MLKHSTLTIVIALLLCIGASIGSAFPSTYNIAIVVSGDLKEYNQAFNGIVHSSEWEGTKIAIQRFDFDSTQSLEIGRKLMRLHPDLIFTIGTQATAFTTNLIHDIPIIFCMVFDTQVLESLKVDGRQNVFGIDCFFPPKTQLEILQKILPDRTRIGILFDPKNSGQFIQEASLLAKEHGIDLVTKEVVSESDVLPSLESIRANIDVLLGIPDKTIYAPHAMKSILLFTLRNKIPLVGLSSSNVSAGALFSLFCDYSDIGSQAAKMATEVLKGKKLPTLHIEEPRKRHIALNVRTAEITSVRLSDEVVNSASIIYGMGETR